MHQPLEPKLFSILKEGYTLKHLAADLSAGVIVGVVALPLAIAFAIASGVKPEQGLYTAIVAGLVVAVLGGSRVQVSGPTGAFIVVIYGIVQQHGYNGLVVATLLAGVMLVLMGFARMGQLLKFVPYPLVVGFTSGIALIIFSSQIRDLFALQVEHVPADFIEKWGVFIESASTFNLAACAIGFACIAIILVWPRVSHRIPGSLVAIIVATAAVHLFDIPVETVGTRFGSVPNDLPTPQFPAISWALINQLFSPAITIALLAAIESLLSAVVADGMIGSRHRSNMELVAQGAGNILSSLFGGIPATGAIARTATNIKNGGRTPVSAIVHAVTLLVIMVFMGHWAELIPMPALAAILVVVAYNMSEWHSFMKMFRSPRSDIAVMLATFLLTVLIDLTVAIEVGVAISALLFLRRMANVSQASIITRELQALDDEGDDQPTLDRRAVPDGVEVFEIYGTLFFGAVDQFKDSLRQLERKPRVLILRMRNLLVIDATGLRALEDLHEQSRKDGTSLILSGVHAQPVVAMQTAGLLEKIGEENVCSSLDEALARARTILGLAGGTNQNP